jgi:sugar (pentulose or hexulose) kinase
MTESGNPVASAAEQISLVARCHVDQIILEVHGHPTDAILSEWSRSWEAYGDDGQPLSELDPHVWWNAFGECWLEAIAAHGAAEITGLSIQGGDTVLVCVDASGEVLQPALCGPDPRMEPDAKWLISQLPGGADDWERITGAAPSSERMVAKCSWLHRSDPDTWGQIAQLLPLSAWLVGKLAGTSQPPEISPALAQTTGFWSVGDGAYSRLICQIIDAKRDLVGCLPSVSASGRAQASVEWNNIPVSCG